MHKKSNVIDQLRQAIRDSGQSQLAVAKILNISQPQLNRFVNGERQVSLEIAAKLCEYLNLELKRK